MARSSTSFQPGHPGGPGRRKGSKNRSTEYKEQIKKHFGDAAFGEVIKAMVDQAKDGDVAAAKLLLSYRLGMPTTHAEVSTDLNVRGSSSAAQTLAAQFGVNNPQPRPDDEDEEDQSGEELRRSVA